MKLMNLINLISYKRLINKANFVSGLYMLPVILPMMIINFGAKFLFPSIYQHKIYLYALTIPISMLFFGLWIKYAVSKRINLEVSGNAFIAGAKTWICSLFPMLSFCTAMIIVSFMRSFLNGILIRLEEAFSILIFSYLALFVSYLANTLIACLVISFILVPHGAAINHLFNRTGKNKGAV